MGCPEGTMSTQVVPGFSLITDRFVDFSCSGDERDARLQVPLTKTPFLRTSSGPLPVGTAMTSDHF